MCKLFKMFSVLSPKVLANIDEMVIKEVTPYIKTMQALPEEIQLAATHQAKYLTSEEYFANLKDGWKAHNDLAQEIDKHLVRFYTSKDSFENNDYIGLTRELIRKAFATERKKRIYSAGVKLSIDANLPWFTDRYKLTASDTQLLLSCWRTNFWELRRGMHAEYLLCRRTASKEESSLEQNILTTFHAGEQLLLESRLSNHMSALHEGSESYLRKILEGYHSSLKSSKEILVKGGYLTQDRPDLKALQKLVDYDNRQEYLFGYNLHGMPDLFLRKEVANLLVSHELLDVRSSVVFYDEPELDQGLQKMEKINAESNFTKLYSIPGTLPTDYTNNLWGSVYIDDTRFVNGN